MSLRPYSASYDRDTGRMSMRYGMGDVPGTCGSNPCGFFESSVLPNFLLSPECKNWICCMNPGGPACTSVSSGVIAGATQATTQEVTGTIVDAIKAGVLGIGEGAGAPPAYAPAVGTVLALAIAGAVLFVMVHR